MKLPAPAWGVFRVGRRSDVIDEVGVKTKPRTHPDSTPPTRPRLIPSAIARAFLSDKFFFASATRLRQACRASRGQRFRLPFVESRRNQGPRGTAPVPRRSRRPARYAGGVRAARQVGAELQERIWARRSAAGPPRPWRTARARRPRRRSTQEAVRRAQLRTLLHGRRGDGLARHRSRRALRARSHSPRLAPESECEIVPRRGVEHDVATPSEERARAAVSSSPDSGRDRGPRKRQGGWTHWPRADLRVRSSGGIVRSMSPAPDLHPSGCGLRRASDRLDAGDRLERGRVAAVGIRGPSSSSMPR